MNAFEKLYHENKFFLHVLKDGESYVLTKKLSSDKQELNEYEQYIEKVAFYLVNTLEWCKQLDLAVKLLSNYNYSKKINFSEADYLVYNIENYLIRINSVYDRILQLINAVFYLGNNEELVGHAVIINNLKVKNNFKVEKVIRQIQKFLKIYSQDRHTLIHKHSYDEDELNIIKIYYSARQESLKNLKSKGSFKAVRAAYFKEYLSKRKNEFSAMNINLEKLIEYLFELLFVEYKKQKTKIKNHSNFTR